MMKRTIKKTLRPGSIALGLGLILTTLCYGQSSYAGPPHNVIYWDGGENLQQLANSSYTDVIVDFIVPNSSCSNVYWEGGTPPGLGTSVQTLHSAGKTVLVSFGGSDVQSSNYAACDNNVNSLASNIANVVTGNGFDGVDIDFEDSIAFVGAANYDGVQFLTDLTNDLYNTLPQWSIITHAPQTPYWMPDYNNAYGQIWQNTNGEISWFNNQTYNNCIYGGTDGPPPPRGPPCTAQDKITNYESIVSQFQVPAIKLVMGLPVSYCATTDNNGNCNGDEYIPLNDGSNDDVRTVILTLFQTYPTQFGGIMGWDYSLDLSDDNGSWGSSIWGALYNWQPNWETYNQQTGLCLGSDSNGNVYTTSCDGDNFTNWRFDVNAIRDAQTGYCLDSDGQGNVYTQPCSAGFSNWEFFGHNIFDRQTRLCLQDNSGNPQLFPGVVTAPCDPNNLSQLWW